MASLKCGLITLHSTRGCTKGKYRNGLEVLDTRTPGKSDWCQRAELNMAHVELRENWALGAVPRKHFGMQGSVRQDKAPSPDPPTLMKPY